MLIYNNILIRGILVEKFLKVWKKYSFTLLIAFIGLGMFDLRFAVVSVLCMIAPVGVLELINKQSEGYAYIKS